MRTLFAFSNVSYSFLSLDSSDVDNCEYRIFRVSYERQCGRVKSDTIFKNIIVKKKKEITD